MRRDEVLRILNIFNDSGKSMDFTVHMSELKKRDEQLFKLVLEELATGNWEVRYLNTAATG